MTRLQLAEVLRVCPAVQAPEEDVAEVKLAVLPLAVKRVLPRMIGPPDAVTVMVGVQAIEVPLPVEGQLTEETAAVPKVGDPVTLAVLVPLLVTTDTVPLEALVLFAK